MRVVLDTNIFVSALLVSSGLPATAFAAWRDEDYELLVSPAQIAEVRTTLGYERIRRRYQITDAIVESLLEVLLNDAIVVEGAAEVAGAVPQDRDDEAILACAVEGQADLIVSGDRHLLTLGSFRGIPILTVREFLARLEVRAQPVG